MEVIKDAYDAFTQRISSPFAGSILLAFAVWNWKPLWFLLFAEADVAERIGYFEAHSTLWSLYVWPLVTGVGIALVLPWLRYAGAEIAKKPNGKLKALQAEEARSRRIEHINASKAEEKAKSALRVAQLEMALEEEKAKIAFEEAKELATRDAQERQEQAVLDAAKRLAEAREIGEYAEDELREKREVALNENSEAAVELPIVEASEVSTWPFADSLLSMASQSENGQIILDGGRISLRSHGTNQAYAVGRNHRDAMDISDTCEKLEEFGLFTLEDSDTYEITKAGYKMLDELLQSRKVLEPAV